MYSQPFDDPTPTMTGSLLLRRKGALATTNGGPPSVSGGSSLATVAENLPLTYNMATQSLHGAEGTSTAGPTSPHSEQGTPKPFKRGHHRRSSYDSSEIQLEFTRRTTRPSLIHTPSFEEALAAITKTYHDEKAREERLARERKEAEEREKEDCTVEGDCALSCASEDTGITPDDSAIGDSVDSKRSSLDRRSELSNGDWEDQQAPAETAVITKRRILPNFAKGLFSSKTSPSPTTTQKKSVSWRLPFGGGKMKDAGGVVQTSALILEERPSHLPAKSAEEASRHKQMHQEMIEQNKRKEARDQKERARRQEEKNRLEEQAMSACRHWNDAILPRWDEMRSSKRCQELWWQGIPSSIRGKVWALAVGNELNITPELYEIYCKRAEQKFAEYAETGQAPKLNPTTGDSPAQSRENSLAQILLDVSRTFPSLAIFQRDGPYCQSLETLLGTYVCYRPDVGYVQSMSFIAAILLLQMEPRPAFVAFSNLMDRPLQMAFFRLQQPEMTEYFIAFDRYFAQELKELHAHFDAADVRPDLYLIEWVYTIFAKSLPLDVTCRVWDVYFRDGEEFIFKAALGLLRMHEKSLLAMEFDEVVAFLTHLPDTLNGSELFRNIEPFMRNYNSSSERKRFLQILAEVKEKIKPARSDSSSTVDSNAITTSVASMKVSKSLTSFIGDLLKPAPEPINS